MSLSVPKELIDKTTHADFAHARKQTFFANQKEEHVCDIDDAECSTDALVQLMRVVNDAKNAKLGKAILTILMARDGEFDKPIPSFGAFCGVLREYLKHDAIDGWVYVEGKDGKLYPELVTGVSFSPSSARGEDQPRVTLHTTAYGLGGSREERLTLKRDGYKFSPGEVVRKKIRDTLESKGIHKETPALKEAYLASFARYESTVAGEFAEQFRFTGRPLGYEKYTYGRRNEEMANRKVIHDLEEKDLAERGHHVETSLFGEAGGSVAPDGTGEVPAHPLIRCFDLKSHEFYWVHADFLTPYVYDESLREKLILPDSHRELLDILTTDLDAFVNDFIENKSAGNVILCKGAPGVGKTLTAECYSEIMKRPLYMVHSGTLGIDATTIEKNLDLVFARIKRWNAVSLLDEADIFVAERGHSLDQNAIVAVFLRKLEYFDGLMFMTTNRFNIDDAILSRFAAIINYELPSRDNAAKVWKVMATQFENPMTPELLEQVLDAFPKAAPRDIKMLMRRTLRICKSKKEPLTIDAFRRSAMFQNFTMADQACVD